MSEQELKQHIEQIRRDRETVTARRDELNRQIAELTGQEACAKAALNRMEREAVQA